MKVAVVGAGLMGRAVAWDLKRSEGVEKVLLVDVDGEQLKAGASFAGIEATVVCDVTDASALRTALEGYDVVCSAVPFQLHPQVAEACIACGAHMVDLGGRPEGAEELYNLNDKAVAAGVTIIPDCGLAPGLAGILAMAGVEELEECEAVEIRCGTLPVHSGSSLRQNSAFSLRRLVNEYTGSCVIIQEGEPATVTALTGLEEIVFDPPFENLEAFYTSGALSTLLSTLGTRVMELDFKTIRYPGHADAARRMIRETGTGALEVLEKQLAELLPIYGPDVTLLRVDCIGEQDGVDTAIRYELIDRYDEKTGLSSLMRCTAFPAAAVVRYLGDGTISVRGTQPQELVVPPRRLLNDLAKRGLRVEKMTSEELIGFF